MHSHGFSVEEYLRSLPHGLDSYPEAHTKASLVSIGLELRPLGRDAVARLPTALQQTVLDPPPATSWIPSVHYLAIQVAIAETYSMGSAELGEAWYVLMERLMNGPIYSGLFRLLDPQFVLRTAAARWSQFHRGWTIAIDRETSPATLMMRYPSGLIDEKLAPAYAAVWQAVLDAGRGSASVETRFVRWGPERARFHIVVRER